ncbi:MAG TPA: DUF885 domain-containing protein [Verrucomicrobiales bacterium]|nr:DUF885 domain-containing protein [Verrucomicrobiales bacterium]
MQLPAADPSVSPTRNLIDHFRQDRGALERLYSIELSAAHRDRLTRLYRESLDALDRLDFEKLDQAGRIDWLLFRNQLQFQLGELDYTARKAAEVQPLLPFADTIVALEEGRRRLQPQEPRASAAEVAGVPATIKSVRERLEEQVKDKSAPGPVIGRRAAMAVDDLRRSLRDWNRFYAEYHPSFTWWLKEPVTAADKALEDYAWFLREKLAGYKKGEDEPVIGDPIGREALLDYLRAEFIPYTPEELIALAEKEFAWCEREMKRAATDLGFDGDWAKAMAHVSQLHVEPGDQPTLIRRLAEEAIRFLEERDLVTIPPLAKETWRMEMMPAERQKVNPYFLGGEVIQVSYPTDEMSHEDKLMSMRGNNVHFSRATVHHELIPGHHLQGFMAQRYHTHRSLFRTPFLVEGWALYWEMLLWDLGFPQSAEDRVGMLFWRSHRCARIIFSLKFHLGEMTAQECIDYLIKRVGHEPRNATAEVRRSVAGDYSPTYQAAYMLGGLQIRAMHKELVASGRMTNKQFHDAILLENSIPIELIRASLTKQPLGRDFTTSWRFYGE